MFDVILNTALFCISVFKGAFKSVFKGVDKIMPSRVMTETTASISELKKNPEGVVASGDGEAVAILNRNTPSFYCIPAQQYEYLMDKLDDIELARLVSERQGQDTVEVDINVL